MLQTFVINVPSVVVFKIRLNACWETIFGSDEPQSTLTSARKTSKPENITISACQQAPSLESKTKPDIGNVFKVSEDDEFSSVFQFDSNLWIVKCELNLGGPFKIECL